MTKDDKDALRAVAPALERLLDECLREAPVADINKTLDGVHTNDMLAHTASVMSGFLRLATMIQTKLQITRQPARPKATRAMVNHAREIPKQQ
tara:strand:- start:145 stop:423 length:279 start_codon:yes stop_codon:yes gene_type:complete